MIWIGLYIYVGVCTFAVTGTEDELTKPSAVMLAVFWPVTIGALLIRALARAAGVSR